MKAGLSSAELVAYKAWFEETYPDNRFVLHPAFVQQWKSSMLIETNKEKH